MAEQKKYHLIYKITNNINGHFYIGKHSTCDINDTYMGSGRHLRNAINKYGIENFTKEILFYCENENDAYELEREIVTTEFIKREDTYNETEGGLGWSKESARRSSKLAWDNEKSRNKMLDSLRSKEFREVISNSQKERWNDPEYKHNMIKIFKERWNDEDYKSKMSKITTDRLISSWKDPIYRENKIEKLKERWKDPEYKNYMNNKVIETWKREDRKEKSRLNNYFINSRKHFNCSKPWMTKYSSNFWISFNKIKLMDKNWLLDKILRERKRK